MKIGCLWVFLYSIAIVPAALFGGIMASSFVYNYDHWHGPRLSDQAYMSLLNGSEALAAIACGMPGLFLVGWSQVKSRREDEQERAARRTTGDEDETVWPSPPLE